MPKDKLNAGWGLMGVRGFARSHYFLADSTVSLCGKRAFYFGPRFDDNHNSVDNCAECKKRRERIVCIKPKRRTPAKKKPE